MNLTDLTVADEKTVRYARRGTTGTLTLSGNLDIFEAQAFYAAAGRVLADTKATAVSIDLRGVLRLDLSGLQILCALRRDLEAAGRTWAAAAPAALTDMLARTGFSL